MVQADRHVGSMEGRHLTNPTDLQGQMQLGMDVVSDGRNKAVQKQAAQMQTRLSPSKSLNYTEIH